LDPVAGQSAETHSAIVRQFFENLLPEGQALDDAAATYKVSRANLVGLMIAMGKETTGALSIQLQRESPPDSLPGTAVTLTERRVLSKEELSGRIRARPAMPFSVWDGKVRLSIAGFQDKIAVYKSDDEWFFVDGPEIASTVILKPEPVTPDLAGLTTNEFLCMRLAFHSRLPVANVRLVHIPEPILEIDRFDRLITDHTVKRLHVIDGCQALGMSVAMKYERPYGSGKDVQNIRDGASLQDLFLFLDKTNRPAAQRLQLLRWVLFQVLTGNADAHAKNISFYCSAAGTWLTPTYDLVCTRIYPKLDDQFAMAIGDAFTENELTACEWAYFAHNCKLPARLVAEEMRAMLKRVRAALPVAEAEAQQSGADANTIMAVSKYVRKMCDSHEIMAKHIPKVDATQF
jgi:serine/threonine-protein kinase HipA